MLIEDKEIYKETKCYHCDESCKDHLIQSQDKDFCCYGCKTVFEILEENDLCAYYDLGTNPGLQGKSINASKFDYLESQAISEKILNYASDRLNKVTFHIPAIHCSSCIYLLEHLHRINPAVISSKINFTDKEVSIDFNPNDFSLKDLAVLLTQLGYEPEINLNSVDKKKKENNNLFYLKLGVAGFCFGNIMLLSFPDYFGFEVAPEFQQYFTFISTILSLPVLLFSSSDYFYSAYIGLQKKHANIDIPIALGISALFLRSLFEVITQSGTGYFDSLTGLVFFLLIGKWFQTKTYQSLSFNRDYTSYFPLAITRILKDISESVLVNELIIGDKILVKNEEIIPADALLLSESANIDYSFVTGESVPIQKRKNDKIFAGGRIKGLAAIFQVVKPVSQNYLTQLWNNEAFAKNQSHQTQQLIDKISKYFTAAIILIAIMATSYWLIVDISQAFFVFIAVLIVACPCALALATPFTLGSVLTALGKQKFYLKNAQVIENIWNINHIVFDKTGTITTNDFSELIYEGRPLTNLERNNIKVLVQNSTHPISTMIDSYLNHSLSISLNNTDNQLVKFKEFAGKGLEGIFNKQAYKLGSANFVNAPYIEFMKPKGSKSYVSINGKVVGAFIVSSNYRAGLNKLITQLKKRFALTVLSGDNEKEKEKLSTLFPKESNLHFNQKPEAKLEHIQHLQASGESVMMVGDGLNDAGALKISDFGVAITDDMAAFTPASDAILHGSQLHQLNKFMHFIAQSKLVLKIAFVLSFLYNIVGLSFAVSGNLTPIFAAILMPISSITVVVFATLTINFLAYHQFERKQKSKATKSIL